MALAPPRAGRAARSYTKTCATCGAAFTCGPGTGADAESCWCEAVPLVEIEPGADCFCPACLTARTVARKEKTHPS